MSNIAVYWDIENIHASLCDRINGAPHARWRFMSWSLSRSGAANGVGAGRLCRSALGGKCCAASRMQDTALPVQLGSPGPGR